MSKFSKKSLRIRYECQTKQGRIAKGKVEPEQNSWPENTFENNMYAMRLSRDGMVLIDNARDIGRVAIGDVLKIDVEFENKQLFRASIENCWLAPNRASLESALAENHIILSGCPAQNDIRSHLNMLSTNSFTFQVDEKLLRMQQFFIFCNVGICKDSNHIANVPEVSFVNILILSGEKFILFFIISV